MPVRVRVRVGRVKSRRMMMRDVFINNHKYYSSFPSTKMLFVVLASFHDAGRSRRTAPAPAGMTGAPPPALGRQGATRFLLPVPA